MNFEINYFFHLDTTIETPITPTNIFATSFLSAVTSFFNGSIVSSLSFVTEGK